MSKPPATAKNAAALALLGNAPETYCINCIFANQTAAGGLECRRFPPAAGRMTDTAGRWPLVKELEQCGEWKAIGRG